MIRLIESTAEKYEVIRWPQYLVEPQYIEGYFEKPPRRIRETPRGLEERIGPKYESRLETIAKTEGIVCTWPIGTSAHRSTFMDWALEILQMKKRLGMEHVGLGTDGGGPAGIHQGLQ